MPKFNNGQVIETIDFDSFMQVFGEDLKRSEYDRNAYVFTNCVNAMTFIPELFGNRFHVCDNTYGTFSFLTKHREGVQIGQKIVVETTEGSHEVYVIPEFLEYTYFTETFMHGKKLPKIIYKKCAVCGSLNPVKHMKRATNKKYVCEDCLEVKGYCTRNTDTHNKPTNSGLTFGFELECVPVDGKNSIANIIAEYPDFIPTQDASLPTGGVEFKSPIFRSLKGAQKVFGIFGNNADFSHRDCGQHIHVGHQNYNRHCRRTVLDNHRVLFNPLANYMFEHEEDTTRLCGRFFGNYRELTDCHTGHHTWLNLENTNTIEFRISKFVAPNQYYYLANMWGEMMNKIVDFGNRNPDLCDMYEEARKTSAQLVTIFKKYAAGEAFCQKAVQKEKERV